MEELTNMVKLPSLKYGPEARAIKSLFYTANTDKNTDLHGPGK